MRFTHDDSYLISTGGNDKCVMYWKTSWSESKPKNESDGSDDENDDVPKPKSKRNKT